MNALADAGPDDAEALALLHAQAFDRPWDASALRTLLSAPGALAVREGEDGFVLLSRVLDEAEVLTLAVRPAARRAGLGRGLLEAAASLAARAGASVLHLEVAADNDAALALYAAAGFSVTGRRRGYYARGAGAPAVDALLMSRRLNTPAAWPYLRRTRPRQPERAVMHVHDYAPDRIEKLCLDKGMRMTEQRRVIARVLSMATDHPDVEELYRRASAVDPHISIATVYRTVRLFEDAGIVARHDFLDQNGVHRSRYEEASGEHHHHLIDLKSGAVVEFVDVEIEDMKRAIAERLGYRLVECRLELYGVPLDDKSH